MGREFVQNQLTGRHASKSDLEKSMLKRKNARTQKRPNINGKEADNKMKRGR